MLKLRCLSLGVLLAAAPVWAVEVSSTFQYGFDDYTGSRDTFVSTHDWANPPQYSLNYGVTGHLALTRDGRDNPLLYFDLSSIPANSQVISATLELYNSTSSGSQNLPRRIRVFEVLAAWDEGNQNASQIDAPGDHGATGDHAFSYYPGQGTDVLWAGRGMLQGVDFADLKESYADVVNLGWYSWDLSDLARAWIRLERPNLGVVLRDATGYQDGNTDWRDFYSNQAIADPSLRPRLVVVYNPDTPSAHAGADQVVMNWDGSAITLDGSLSEDRPGGNNLTLQYSWAIKKAAFGSAQSGAIGEDAIISFTPDAAGEWVFELTVTNEIAEVATDEVSVRVLRLSASHPRIYLTPAKLSALQTRAVPANPRWNQLEAEADSSDGSMIAKALVSNVKAQSSYCDEAIIAALDLAASPYEYSSKAGDIGLVFDWCYDQLSSGDESALLAYMDQWANDPNKPSDSPGWGNYWPRFNYSWVNIGLAAFGHHADASVWFDTFRHERHENIDTPVLDRIAAGGAWPEGMIYDWIANGARLKSVAAWTSATGENLFLSSAWFAERFGYFLTHRLPGTAEQWGYVYHPYASIGDTERNRGSMANYERIAELILIEQFSDDPLATQLQEYLATPPGDASMDFLAHDEFLWFNPNQPAAPPDLLAHLAEGTGTLQLRSGWPSGAADSDSDVTHLTFQCGDHFTYHQHFDQNSFTLFKGHDLAIDSGVYSGDGLSDHDQNYYVRTIAHNTLVVYNPSEDFSSARPDAYSNDGGQRDMYPASRSPGSIEYFDQHAVHYENGDIDRYETQGMFTYALGDATAAYNNVGYNQAMDTSRLSNVAKVSRFQREFLYLRPPEPGQTDFLVLYDRVGVADPAFSGESTKLLFHTLEEPTLDGSPIVVSPGETLYANCSQASAPSSSSSLHLDFLAPPTRNVRKVGQAAEKAFWVFGTNHDWQWDPGEPYPRPTNDFEDGPYGEWRLELEPADSALEHNFLTVLQPRLSSETVAAVHLVEGNQVEGAHLEDDHLARVVLFSKALDGAPPEGVITYAYEDQGPALNLVCDLTPETTYSLTTGLQGSSRTIELTPDGGGAHQASSAGVLQFTVGSLQIFTDGFESGDFLRWSAVVQ